MHVIGPLLSLGVLLGAALWAGGAVLLPLLVRGRNAALDVRRGDRLVGRAGRGRAAARRRRCAAHAAHASPRGALVGAVLGGALAVAARALRGPV